MLSMSKSKELALQRCNFRENRTMRWRETPTVEIGGGQLISALAYVFAIFKSGDQFFFVFSALPMLREVI